MDSGFGNDNSHTSPADVLVKIWVLELASHAAAFDSSLQMTILAPPPLPSPLAQDSI